MKNIYLLISTTLIAMILSACGGSGGGSNDATFDSGNTKISVVSCNNTTPIYTDIQSGDVLVKETIQTVVLIVHNTNGTKKVCVVSGTAHLLRDN